MDLTRFVALTSTTAAKLYGLYPRKGTIAVGSDADIAIWDPKLPVTIRQENMHDAMDYTPYEGRKVTGWPVTTISRGEVVWRDGAVTGAAGRGRFLPCELSAAARPRGKLPINFDPTSGRLVNPS
jgi:dihydropyrimidinase